LIKKRRIKGKSKLFNKLRQSETVIQIRKKISDGRLDDAFTLIDKLVATNLFSSSIRNELIVYQNRWHTANKQWDLMSITLDELRIEKNRIIIAMLNYINAIEEVEEY
jgi:hypothetical protein